MSAHEANKLSTYYGYSLNDVYEWFSAQYNTRSRRTMATKVNFANVAGPEPVGSGEFESTFIGYKLGTSKTAGQPTLECEWIVNESDSHEFSNKHIWKTYSLQPKALWSLKRDMMRMGADVEEMNSEDAELETILDALIGATNVVVCGEPYEYPEGSGTMRTQFKEIKDLEAAYA
jgi:hypothetical protein